MPIRNYKTRIGAEQSITEIRDLLRKAGARSIVEDYDAKGDVAAIAFAIKGPVGMMRFRLPARVDKVQRSLEAAYAAGQVDRAESTPTHARAVAWRIVKDWLAVQLALIQAEMASLDQVMLPYALVKGGRTVYEAFLAGERGMLALPSPEGER